MRPIDADELLKKKREMELCFAVTVWDIEDAPTIDPESLRPTGADRFAIVFGEISAYNDHEEWLWELADKLSELEAGKYFCCPITTEEWLTDKHALWMMLVSAYGNWGTSIRHGWIEKTAEAAKFINEATGRYAEWRSCT